MRMRNHHGFSMVEALIAAGILAVVVAGVTTMVGGNSIGDVFKGRMQANNACLAEANRIMSNIKQKGLVRERANIDISSGATFPATITSYTGANLEPGIANADRWDTDLPIYGTPASGIYPLRPHIQIMGYMNALQSMYNSNKAAFCPASGFGASTYAGDGTAANNIFGTISNATLTNLGATTQTATAYLKIQPFNTDTGALIACGSAPDPIDIRPPMAPPNTATALANSINVPTTDTVYNSTVPASPYPQMIYSGGVGARQNHPGGTTLSAFSVPTGTLDNRGFAVTVTISYVDRKGTTKTCAVQEKFQYSSQPRNPNRLEFSDIETTINDNNEPESINGTLRMISPAQKPVYPTYNATPNPTLHSSPNNHNPTNTLIYGCGNTTDYNRSVRLRLKNVRPGSIMMCRNLSVERTAPSGYGTAVQSMAQRNFPQRTLFFSTELLQNKYFQDQESADSIMGDMMVLGLYYPVDPTGDYYCRTADGCNDLPRFGAGYTGLTPAATTTGTQADGTRHYYPQTTNDYGRLSTTVGYQPCETITVCGQTPNNAETRFVKGDTATGVADAYHLQIDNLPVGCEVNVQMVEVDAGYNTKSTVFREYIHERVPGNKLCRAGRTTGTNIPGHNSYEWFFACRSDNSNPNTSLGTPAVDCSTLSGSDIDTPCCVNFPFYPPQSAPLNPTNHGVFDP